MATDLERLTVLIEANTKSYENAMLRLQQKTDKAIRASNKSVASLDAQFKRMSATVSKAAGILGISLGATAFVGMIKGAVEAGSKVGDLANQLGITAEQVQEFSFAAAQSGSSQEGFVKAMTAMNRVLGDAQRFSKTAVAEFTAIGLSMADLKGKNPGEVFELILQQINKLSDPLQRNAALIKFFGRSGMEMAEMTKIGVDGIEQLRQKARELGLVLSNEQIAALKEAGDKIDTIGTAAQAAGMRMAVEFLPAIDALEKLVTSAAFQQGLADTAGWIGTIVKFLAEHPELASMLIGASIGKAVGGVPGAIVGGLAKPAFDTGTAIGNWLEDNVINGPQGNQANKGDFLGGGPNVFGTVPLGPATSFGSLPQFSGWHATATSTGGGSLPGFTDPAIEQQQKVYEKLAASLALAQFNLTATDREQAIANDLARLGTDATQKQRDSIALLSGQLFDQKKALADYNAEAQLFGQTLYDAFDSLLIQGNSVNDVLANMAKALAQAALQASLLGTGPLAGLFGTQSATSGGLGGLFGSVFSGLFGGFRAGGGSVRSGSAYVVGEKGPELFVPKTSGVIAANSNTRGVTVQIINQVDATGADVAAVDRLTKGLTQVNKSIEQRAVAAIAKYQQQVA